jgi:PKD repeat protein
MLRLPKTRDRNRSRGQSVVEFALVVPILLLLMLVAIDFGRIYLGWVNLQQMARIAANDAAEHASAWQLPDNAAKQAERAKYQDRITRDAEQINCELPNPLPDPVIAFGTALGAHVTVGIDCEFSVITPIVSGIVGGTVLLSAETTFPVKEGVVAAVPGGGAPVAPPTEAKFIGTPAVSGWAPLDVTFTDQSTNGPTSWLWTFNDLGGTGSGSVSDATSLSQGPHTVTYGCAGVPDDVCTFTVSLRAGNGGGTDTETKVGYVTVKVPPATGPIAEFTGSPLSGVEPVTTNFQFVDVRAGAVTYTNYEWDFTSDGTFDQSGPTMTTATHTYATSGSYDVTLRVTDSTGSSTLTKNGYVNVTHKICVVPNFFGYKSNQATRIQNDWHAQGFTTNVTILPGPPGSGNYTIQYQSINGSTIDPQPAGCGSVLSVGP